MKSISNKHRDKNELALQSFIISGYERTKLYSMIYEMGQSKRESLGYHQKPYHPKTNILMKPSDPSSSSTAQKGLKAYFMPAAEKGRILNQIEPMINNSQILKDSRSQTKGSKILRKFEPKTLKSKIL